MSNSLRFGPGKLPVAYTPMSFNTMATGDVFGPIEFTITPESHSHHLSFLNASGTPLKQVELWQNTLLPFLEVWPLARVVSRARFGRVNEVVALGASCGIHRMAPVGVPITASATLCELFSRKGLAIAKFKSTAMDDSGSILTETTDTLLLLHDSDPVAVRAAIKREDRYRARSDKGRNPSLHLGFRYKWDPTEWHNNIHVPEYARSVGYDNALVEGAGVIDVIFSKLFPPPTDVQLPVFVEFHFRRPLYSGLEAKLDTIPTNKEQKCHLVGQEPSTKGIVLVQARILNKGG